MMIVVLIVAGLLMVVTWINELNKEFDAAYGAESSLGKMRNRPIP